MSKKIGKVVLSNEDLVVVKHCVPNGDRQYGCYKPAEPPIPFDVYIEYDLDPIEGTAPYPVDKIKNVSATNFRNCPGQL